MPYLSENDREPMRLSRAKGIHAGKLTYDLQQVLKKHLDWYTPYNYQDLAIMLGCLEGAKADLIRRKINPYEEMKQKENGDVW